MDSKEIFEHFSDEVARLLDEGESPAEIAEILAAVSLDLALQTAPSPEHAYLAVLEGFKSMTAVRISLNEDDDSDEDADGELGIADEAEVAAPMGTIIH